MTVIELHLPDGQGDAAPLRDALAQALRQVLPDGTPTFRVRDDASAPQDVVRAYLSAMEARDLNGARDHLAPGFTMHFPGAEPMTTLEDLIAWAAPRYRHVAKTYDGFDTCHGPGPMVVFARGTLHGKWPDGSTFDGIRFIDRFELADGKITLQDVWNDIAEHRA